MVSKYTDDCSILLRGGHSLVAGCHQLPRILLPRCSAPSFFSASQSRFERLTQLSRRLCREILTANEKPRHRVWRDGTCRKIGSGQKFNADLQMKGRRPHFLRAGTYFASVRYHKGSIRPLEQFHAQRKWTSDRDSGRGAGRLSRSTDTGCADRQHRPDNRTCRDLLWFFRALILVGRKRDPHAGSVPQQ
jgi:hypothetical protein